MNPSSNNRPRGRGRPRSLAPEDERAVATIYRLGVSSFDLAEIYGVSISTIITIVRRNGGTPPPKGRLGSPNRRTREVAP